MEDFDIMDDAAIQRRMEKQHERVEILRNNCNPKRMERELRKMLLEAGKLLDQYLKMAVCEGRPVRAEYGCVVLNPLADDSLADTFAVFRYRERNVIIKYGRSVSFWDREEDYEDSDETEETTFSFYYGYDAQCSSLSLQYDAAKDMLRALKQNGTYIIKSIDDAVDDAIHAIIKKVKNGKAYQDAPCFYNTKGLDGDED